MELYGYIGVKSSYERNLQGKVAVRIHGVQR